MSDIEMLDSLVESFCPAVAVLDAGGDPDGPRVGLPERLEKVRVPPPFPLATYRFLTE